MVRQSLRPYQLSLSEPLRATTYAANDRKASSKVVSPMATCSWGAKFAAATIIAATAVNCDGKRRLSTGLSQGAPTLFGGCPTCQPATRRHLNRAGDNGGGSGCSKMVGRSRKEQTQMVPLSEEKYGLPPILSEWIEGITTVGAADVERAQSAPLSCTSELLELLAKTRFQFGQSAGPTTPCQSACFIYNA